MSPPTELENKIVVHLGKCPVYQLFTGWIYGSAAFVRTETLVKGFGVVPHMLMLSDIPLCIINIPLR